MKSIIQSLFFLSLIVITTSCDLNMFQPDTVMVRITNVSEFNAKDIILNNFDFGDLMPGETSDYIDVQDLMVSGEYVMTSFDADLEEVKTGNRKCELCGGGVEHLTNGRYTLELQVYGGNKEEGLREYILLTVQP